MDPQPAQLGQRQLFGGAIVMDLPVSYADASDLRQIPNNQEVFLSQHSDTSLVVEVLALVEEGLAANDLWHAARYHFDSIAHDNSSLSNTILTPAPASPLPSQPTSLPSTPSPVILTGTQKIHKFSHDPTGAPRPGHEADTADTVFIALALWRVWLHFDGGRKKKADLVCSVNVNLSAVDGKGEQERLAVEEWWTRSVQSLRILDFELFGDEA
ncbi:hypothetical protein DB88DRAFT_497668 [Papiliotrema laurentii]|uniref:Uncharacterized protein n=1 Tax=Papiliotrema laurentii TaxID=5418 RepID=A0AAD9CVE9_PAPLA|nr:hypothetical protein DB88DRAFT_497668 [Papiliotrema laurentii]